MSSIMDDSSSSSRKWGGDVDPSTVRRSQSFHHIGPNPNANNMINNMNLHTPHHLQSPQQTRTTSDRSFLGGRPTFTATHQPINKHNALLAQSRLSPAKGSLGSRLNVSQEDTPFSSSLPSSNPLMNGDGPPRGRSPTLSTVLNEPKRNVEDKVERLVALREAIHVALTDVYAKLETIETTLRMITQPNSEIALTLREVAKFLRSLVDDAPAAISPLPSISPSLQDNQQSVFAVANGQERLQFFKDIMNMALVEIRCKLGSLQKRVAETTSLSTCMYDANTIRSLKQFLDGKGKLEIDPKKHKLVATDDAHRAKVAQLAMAVARTASDIIVNLSEMDVDDAFANEVWGIMETDEEIPAQQAPPSSGSSVFGSGSSFMSGMTLSSLGQMGADSPYNALKMLPLNANPNDPPVLINQLNAWNEQIQAMLVDEDPAPETAALLTHFANKLRNIKKRIMRVRAAAYAAGTPEGRPLSASARLPKLILVLKRERDEGNKGDENEEIQEDISALNTRRHLLTLSIRNLDRKINFLIKSRKHKEEATEMEEEEVYQFFDQTTSEENPLGANKEHYEQFISVLRKQPRYLASIVKNLAFSEMEPLVQTITFSLFSDLYLAREEYLMLSLIDAIMTVEFENCKEIEAYLRGNSFITKLISGYTKRQSGRLHLTQALKEPITAVIKDLDLDLEMDPIKLYKQIVAKESVSSSADLDEPAGDDSTSSGNGKLSYEAMANHPDVKLAFNEHKFKLVHFCKLFLDNIVGSMTTMPFGLRWIAKQLAVKAKEKFGQTITQASLDILLGGFIFLRYLCPAIVAPESHGIVSHVTGSARRNLVLIAKVLQNLANRCQFSKKEAFMAPMNTFLTEHESVLRNYFSVLVMVGDSATYYRASSLKRTQPHQIERTVTISPNELYDIHRKIVKSQPAILKNPNDPLALLLPKMNPIPENLPRRQNKFVLLNVYSIVDDQQEEKMSEEQQFVHAFKDKLVQVLPLASEFARPISTLNLTNINNNNANGLNDAPLTNIPLSNPSPRPSPRSPPTTTPRLLAGNRPQNSPPNPRPITPPSKGTGNCIKDALLSIKELPTDLSATTSIPSLLADFERVPESLLEDNSSGLIDQMEKDYQQRVIVRDALLTEKVEQLEALEHQKKEVARLMEEKKIYSQYLQNVMLDAYLKKIKNKPMIGPYKFTIKQLEKAGVVVPSAGSTPNVSIKMSCTNPGSVNITTKYQKFSKFYELQLLDLMDDLVLHDVTTYGDINFDIRKLISFINKYILG